MANRHMCSSGSHGGLGKGLLAAPKRYELALHHKHVQLNKANLIAAQAHHLVLHAQHTAKFVALLAC